MSDNSLQEIINKNKVNSFVDPETASDEEALGLLISFHFQWDGLAILRAFSAALEDANFHHENAKVRAMIDALEN